jgi:hypothetical protein
MTTTTTKMTTKASSGFRFPFLIHSEQEALTLAMACPNGLFVRAFHSLPLSLIVFG